VGIELVGREGAAAILGVNSSRISQLVSGDPNFPRPVTIPGVNKIWRKDVIQAYKRKREGRSTLTMHSLSLPTQPLTASPRPSRTP
jgi:predicted DNA-binding transcriptional regulator AlpA